MTIIEFAKLVEQLRGAQKKYFRTREHKYLLESKQFESWVDKAIKEILDTERQEKLL